MSDQISENMARKLAQILCENAILKFHTDTFTEKWRAAGLIKKSALDGVREWVASVTPGETAQSVGRYVGVRECSAQFELAITEILEERE